MTLRINLLWFQIVKVELEFDEIPARVTTVDRGVKAISKLWVKGMTK